MTRKPRLLALLLTMGLLAAACGGESGTGDSNGAGSGEIRPARADWSTGYFQAAVYAELLRELGFDVADESESELGPDLFYPALAQGEFDYWAHGWFPSHDADLETDVAGGGAVEDHVSRVGTQVEAGAVQGFLIDKATAEAHGIESLEQIVEDDALRDLFDTDGDGTADLVGCNRSWGCAGIIDDTIEANGWEDALTQVQDDYNPLFAEVVDRYERGEPVLFYTWTPNYTVAQLVPGEDVVWLGLGGEPFPGQDEATDLPNGECVADPCETGFTPADIQVVGNNDFLAANPTAARLFEVIEIPVADIAAQNLEMNAGADTQADIVAAAERWIEANRSQVDDWLEDARSAG